LTMSFYVPPGVEIPEYHRSIMASVGSPTSGSLRIDNDSGTTRVKFYMTNSITLPAITMSADAIIDLTEGVHAISASWGSGHTALYIDGACVFENTGDTSFDMDFLDDGNIYIGFDSYGPWPFIPLTFRLDDNQHRDQIPNIHAALMDGSALGTVVAARGRLYEITSIPSTPRMVEGATYWMGNLGLRQVDYDRDNADITTKEK